MHKLAQRSQARGGKLDRRLGLTFEGPIPLRGPDSLLEGKIPTRGKIPRAGAPCAIAGLLPSMARFPPRGGQGVAGLQAPLGDRSITIRGG